MQIIIELTADCKELIHSNKEAKRNWERFHLAQLLRKLEEDGYKINTLYGRFIFNESTKEVMDVGIAGGEEHASIPLVDSIFATKGKLAIIFTDKKYVVFCNRYFVAIHFCHMRKVRPLSIHAVEKNYDALILNESKETLDKLYFEQFEFVYGKGHEPVSCFLEDNKLRTNGYAVAGPILDGELDWNPARKKPTLEIFEENKEKESDTLNFIEIKCEGYGYDLSNPIKTCGPFCSKSYLNSLEVENGMVFKWRREGSLSGENQLKSIDKYSVYVYYFDKPNDVCRYTLYVDMYHHDNDTECPEHFSFRKDVHK